MDPPPLYLSIAFFVLHAQCTIDFEFEILKSTNWKSPFFMACKEGQFDVVEEILNNQFNLNAQDVNEMTYFVLV